MDYLRLRVIPVLGTSPSIFGQALASYVLCQIGTCTYDVLCDSVVVVLFLINRNPTSNSVLASILPEFRRQDVRARQRRAHEQEPQAQGAPGAQEGRGQFEKCDMYAVSPFICGLSFTPFCLFLHELC